MPVQSTHDPAFEPENALTVALEEESERQGAANHGDRSRDEATTYGRTDGNDKDGHAPLLSGGGSRYLQRSLSHVKLLGDATMESLRQSSPIPVPQLAAICCTQLSQAIQVTLPYTIAVFMVRDFGYTDEREVSQKTGLMASYFCLAMFLTAYFWGNFSDRYGRKPVIVIGNTASAAAVLFFGFAQTYQLACLSRFLGGFLNGLFGALKTMIGESCDASSQGQALVFLSISWGIGTTIGPVIGGFLARPCDKYSSLALCGDGELFETRPFLLPCLAAGVVQVLATLMSIFCMHETLPARAVDDGCEKQRRGVDCRRSGGESWWHTPSLDRAWKLMKGERGQATVPLSSELAVMKTKDGQEVKTTAGSSQSESSLSSGEVTLAVGELQCHDREECRSKVGSDLDREEGDVQLVEQHGDGEANCGEEGEQGLPEPELPWWKHREVVLCLLGYGLIAFIFNLSDEVTPIYASAPGGDGGLGLSTSELGIPLSVSGIALLLYASLGFKRMQRRFGVLRLARFGLYLSSAVWLLHPVASLLMPDTTGALVVLSIAHVGKSVAGVSSFTSSMVLVNVASPSKQLGRVNGMGQSVAAFVRGVGPAAGGFIWALTLGTGLPYHQFIVYSGIAVMSVATTAVYGKHLQIAALDGL